MSERCPISVIGVPAGPGAGLNLAISEQTQKLAAGAARRAAAQSPFGTKPAGLLSPAKTKSGRFRRVSRPINRRRDMPNAEQLGPLHHL